MSPAAPEAALAAQAPAPDSVVESIRQESGFDVETGAILDRQKFEKWKRQKAKNPAAGQPSVSNMSLFEAFQKARSAIGAWVDDGNNRICMMEADLEEIKRLHEIQRILAEYAGYGADMRTKLLRYLDFIIDNRRKYYAALQSRSRAN